MKLPLSNRLLKCAEFVRPGAKVADVGCDHGYLSIHLLTQGIAAGVYAGDVNEGPLQSAVIHAKKFGVSENIHFYLSDGVRNLPRDFDTLICAGMGADTIISILEAAPWLKNENYTLVLQCQSKRPELRKYLYSQGYAILREDLAQDGKFIYTVMEVRQGNPMPPAPVDYYITPALLQSGSPLLPAFVRRVTEGIATALQGMEHAHSEKLPETRQLLRDLEDIGRRIPGGTP